MKHARMSGSRDRWSSAGRLAGRHRGEPDDDPAYAEGNGPLATLAAVAGRDIAPLPDAGQIWDSPVAPAVLLAATETIEIRSLPSAPNRAPAESAFDVWLAGALSLGGLASASGRGGEAAPATASGTVVDGYVANARVFRDGNGNGRWDADEAYVFTDGHGRFTGLGGSGPLLALPGDGAAVDVTTGVAFRQSYSAPEGARAITPLTTLLAGVLQAAPTLGAPLAGERVAAALGIDPGISLLDFDPQSPAGLAPEAALAAQRAAALLANFIAVGGAALQAAGLATQIADTGHALRAELAHAVLGVPAGGRLDFADAEADAAWLRGAAARQRAGMAPGDAAAGDAALSRFEARCDEMGRSLANVAAATGEARNGDEIAGLQIVAQSTVVASLATAFAAPPGQGVIAGGDADAVRADGRRAAALTTPAGAGEGGPTVHVTVDHERLHVGERAELSIRFSEPVVGPLGADRFSVVGGRLADFSSADGRDWRAVFTPDEDFTGTAALRLTGEVRNAADRVGSPGNLVQLAVDTSAPAAPGVSLRRDSGASGFDLLTSDDRLAIDRVEPRATLQYSRDQDDNWREAFNASEGENRVWLRQIDAAGNSSATTPFAFVLDTVAPELTISPAEDGVAHGPVLFRFAFSEPVSGFDIDDIVVAGGEKGAFTALGGSLYTLVVVPPADRGGTIHLTVAAASAADRAGNFNRPASHAGLEYQPPAPPGGGEPGQATVDLGSFGKLIAPVFVDGRWYYYWDRSGDGSSANAGHLNGGGDRIDHNSLDRLFNRDLNGIAREGDGSESHRYATLNGVRVALPVAGESPARLTRHAGTAIDNQPAGEINPPYDDLLAIWDGFNGGGTDLATAGVPPGWAAAPYWSATPLEFGHAMGYGHAIVDPRSGELSVMIDQELENVALQLVDAPASTRLTLAITDDTAGTAEGAVRFTFTFSAPVGGFSATDIGLDAGCRGALRDLGGGVFTLDVLPPANASGEMQLTVAANVAFDAAGLGNPGAAASQSFDTRGQVAPGAPVIDLGEYGKLIAPVRGDDGWYYYWDRSGDGSGAERGTLNGGADAVDFATLAALFADDDHHDDDARTATLNGVRVVLPALDELLELREALRGAPDGDALLWECLDSPVDGGLGNERGVAHSAWQANDFWTAAAGVAGHLALALNTGHTRDLDDRALAYAVLQVI